MKHFKCKSFKKKVKSVHFLIGTTSFNLKFVSCLTSKEHLQKKVNVKVAKNKGGCQSTMGKMFNSNNV